ncbi:g9620 [Coccomyxa viridis]|uniref:G9620 protein n=1 Tax=Coccomyxa viridis TaxID=1274662 RepID=A0ABP1G7M1_9CHLO
MICLDLQGLTTSDIPVNAGVHNPTHLPTYDDRLFEGAAPSPAQEGNGSRIHIHLAPYTSRLLAVHGISLIAAAMRRAYRWRCVLHPEGLPAFPRRATDPLPTGERSLYVGCVYMPPMAAAEEEQHYAALMEDILAFQEKGQVVVPGDFNARVGSATTNSDVIGMFGEAHTNANGQRLIQLLLGTNDFRPAELTQAAVTLFEDTLLCSAREVLGLKRCVQVRRHAWWTPELRLLIDTRRAVYVEARAAQERGLETWPTLHGQWKALRSEVKEVARVADYIERSHDPGNADAALDAVPSRDEIAGCVERLRNHKAGTEEGIVNEMLKYGGPALLDMLAGLVETLWTTELVPVPWRSGDIVNIFKKGDKKDPGNYRGITLLNVVGKLYTKGLPARTFTWGQTEIPRVLQYKHLGVIVTPDGRQDTHIKHVITQGNARVLQMGKLLRDKHLSGRFGGAAFELSQRHCEAKVAA